ncbi:MAG: hypothetical protein IME99_08355, partial [Proteobacteria bacterium]|nr:hypothetical protein [Pseudomonadota bacterium]
MSTETTENAGNTGDRIFKGVSYFFALFVMCLMALIVLVLFKESLPSIQK